MKVVSPAGASRNAYGAPKLHLLVVKYNTVMVKDTVRRAVVQLLSVNLDYVLDMGWKEVHRGELYKRAIRAKLKTKWVESHTG